MSVRNEVLRASLHPLKTLALLSALLLPPAFASTAQVSLSLASGSTPVGGSLTLDLTLAAATVQPAALQWTFAYPTSDISSFSVVAGPSAASASKSLYCTNSAGQVTCLLAGMNTNTIPNGVVASVILATSTAAKLSSPIQVLDTSASSLIGDLLSSSGAQGTVSLSGIPLGISSVLCTPTTILGSGSAACTVTLNQAAPSGGVLVSLTDNNPVLTVPATVTVPAGSISAAFTATATGITASSTATITASLNGTSASSAVSLYPAALVTKLACSAAILTGSGSTVCTVTLTRAAPYGGALVTLGKNNAQLTVPASVTVPSGSTSTTFAATAAAITAAATATLSASLNGSSAGFAVSLSPSILLTTLACAPAAITGSGSTLCTVTLNAPAPAGGAVISLADNNPALALPASVTVPAGSTSTTFTATAALITATGTATINASLNGSSAGLSVSLDPAALLTALNCTPSTLTGSGTTSCSVTLNRTAPVGGALVSLASNNPALTVPASVTVPSGVSSATFNASASSITVAGTATLSASLNGSSAGFAVTLSPLATLTSLSCTPASLATGASGTCTVALSSAAPAGGSTVTLASSSALLSVPASVTVAAGSSSTTFAIKALSFTTDSTATLTASLASATRTFPVKLVASMVPTSITCVYSTLTSNTSTNCTVTLNRAAPGGGALVTLSDDSPLLSVPATATVATSSSSVTFPVAVSTVAADSTATIQATVSGVPVSVSLNLTTPPSLTGFTCSPTALTSAGQATCTVTLNKPALASGTSVVLNTASGAVLSVPGSVLVAAGKSSAAFSIKALSVAADSTVTINAALPGSSLNFPLDLQSPAVPSSLSCASATLSAKGSTLCTVTMNRPALAGSVVALSDNSSELTVPASATVAKGSTTVSFYASTSAVTADSTATIKATGNGVSASFVVSLVPPPSLTSFSCSPATLVSGASGTCTITLDKAAPAAGSTITLAKSSALLSAQSSVTVGAGKTSATFSVKALTVTTDATATLDASLSGAPLSFLLNLVAPTAPASLSCLPATLPSNGASTCTVTLNRAAPSGGSLVTLSDDSATLSQPASVTVPAGSTSVTFVATAGVVTANSTATTTASMPDGSATFTSNLASQATAPALVRINAGGTAYTDRLGLTWSADTNTSGLVSQASSAVTGTLDSDLYRKSRYAVKTTLQYQFAAPAGSYNVKLKFAETSFTKASQRAFNIVINGTTVAPSLDVFSAAGGALKALDKDFTVNSTGQIQIQFVPVIDNPMVSAIEITPTPVVASMQSALPKSTRSAASIASAEADPEVPDSSITAATEVGVRFRSTQAGLITGVRFYKGPLDVGVHVGHLWSNGGALLASARFENETESGWQQVDLSEPVAVEAGQSYVVSYQAPYGHFASGAPGRTASAPSGNPLQPLDEALYGYGAGFPTQVRAYAGYLVDAVFEPATGLPAESNAPPSSLSLSCAPRVLRAGEEFECELTRQGPASGDAWSTGLSATSGRVRLPAVVRAAAGQNSVRFRGSVDAAASIPSIEILAGAESSLVRDSIVILPRPGFVLNAPETQYARAGESVRFYVSASNGSGALAQISAAGLPSGAMFLPATGTFSWSPAPGQEGEYLLEFKAVNPDGTQTSVRTRVVVDAGTPVITNSRSLSCTSQELATLEGRWLSQWREEFSDPTGASVVLGGTSVRVNGIPVAVLFASQVRVEFQCPSLEAGSELSVELETAAGASRRSFTLAPAGQEPE